MTSDFEAQLRAVSLRVTRPRLAVLAALRDHPHVDTDTVIALVRADHPRGLPPGDLRRAARAHRRRPGAAHPAGRRDRPLRDPGGDNHHHVVCRSCGAIADVDCAVGHAPCLTASDDHGFVVDEAEVVYWGTCPDCATEKHRPVIRQFGRKQMSDTQDNAPASAQGVDERAAAGCPVAHDSVTAHGSESENPAIDSPNPEDRRPPAHQPGLVAQPARPLGAARPLVQGQPAGRGLQLRQGVRQARRRGPQAGHHRGAHHLAGLVAGRLRPLRRPDDPDELARRGHLPHPRRPRWRRRRRSAVRPAEQLARQRQPRQGPPAAVAGQAEVRPADLVGRPARARRQRRPGVDGLQDLRLRLRPRGRLGARGDLLGPGGRLARRRALRLRQRDGRGRRRDRDGPHLRQPRGPARQRRLPGGGRTSSGRPSPGWR